MLRVQKYQHHDSTIVLSEISALDYLDYVEYLNSLPPISPIADKDTEKDIAVKLNQATRRNLLANARLLATSIRRSQKDKSVDDIQENILENWSHIELNKALSVVQDLCEFPEVNGDDSDEEEEPKNA
ncbi:phage tail protein [Pasteurellaceae bacterium TAE3-ERU1]|nr:phage tail protein [Pasteurellaceae bacterium TAE3-ERU1]